MNQFITGLGLLGASLAGRFTMPRESYLPREVRGTPPDIPEGTDMQVWRYEVPTEQGIKLYAIAFVGKQSKPIFHYRFRDEAHREREIEHQAESRRKTLAYKEERKRERREYKHDYEVGDILSSTWGYDQTNVDFYEVTAVPGPKTVELRKIAQRTVSSEGQSDTVVPEPGEYISASMRKKVSPGGSVKITSYSYASKWSGRPMYATAYGWGH